MWAHNRYDGDAVNRDLEASGLGGTNNTKTKTALAELANAGNVDALAARIQNLRPHGGPAEIRRLAQKMVDTADAASQAEGGTGGFRKVDQTDLGSVLDQSEQIAAAQLKLRQGKLGNIIIDKIGKSDQRVDNRLKDIKSSEDLNE